MKKILSVLFSLITLVTAINLSVFAGTVFFEEDYAGENDIVLASLNGTKPFLGDAANTIPLEVTCYWLSDYVNTYNIKYVSFNGKMSSGANYTYGNYVSALGKTVDEMNEANAADEEWAKDFKALKNAGSVLTDAGLPYGVSIHLTDYYAGGYNRGNIIANEFTLDDFTGSNPNVTVESYDTNSFALIVSEGNTKYVIYQLEAYPRKAVINWFNATNEKHQDKRAFVFTTSFVDRNGAMFTQYDPTVYGYTTAPVKGNSTMNTNMVWYDSPFDGEQIWNHAISKFDNVVMVMSANDTPGKDIVVSKFTNSNGYEVVSVIGNLIDGWSNAGAYPILAKFSEEDKTLDLRYAVPFYEKVGGYVEESHVVVELKKLAPLPEPDPFTSLPKITAQLNGENKAYVNGYEENLFKPNANMTKAEASAIFARLLLGSDEIPTDNTTRFSDVSKEKWYYDEIAYLDTLGFYYTNTSDKYFPDAPITRGEFVELAYFTSNLSGSEKIQFTDVPLDHKYYDAIISSAASGLVNGYEDKTFKPDATITRAEVVTVINRLLSLTVSEYTVKKDTLENVFSDIGGHWAEYNILMASNDKVHGESFYSISPDTFNETATSISFETKQIKVSINKKNGKVEKVTYLPTGENVFAISASQWFTYLKTTTGATLEPTKVELIDGRIKFTYKSGVAAAFIIETFDNYFTVELDTNVPKNISSITFANIDFNHSYSEDDNSFRSSVVSMDTKANPDYHAGGANSIVSASANTSIGVDLIGAKAGIVFSLAKDHREHLKELCLSIDPSRGVTSDHGGAFTYDEGNENLFGDYVIVSSGITPETATDVAKLAKEYSIDQLDIHQGSHTFSNGDFNFTSAATEEEKADNTYISAEIFRERIGDKILAEGVEMGLHTYAFLIDPKASSILTNPEYQKQLAHNEETWTVRGNTSKFKTSIKTHEDVSGFWNSTALPWDNKNTRYILIDEEIILVEKGTTSGFINVKRGQLGTKAAVHKDGAEIRQLYGYFNLFSPIIGSELFYHVADNIAKAYNDGGFDMIYLDGIECLLRYVSKETSYYYYGEFVRRVLSQCEKKPIIEMSDNPAIFWASRGRSGATDYATKAYKEHKKSHVENNIGYFKRYQTATLGWYCFDPDIDERYKNTVTKTVFRDDLDYMGSLAIATDFSMVCQPFTPSEFEAFNRMAQNYAYYGIYTRLRKADYFSEEVKEEILNGKYEYKVFKQDDGSWAFREMYYTSNRVYDTLDSLFTTGEGNNPFSAQTPFVRIEQRYSTLGENEIVVLTLDENANIKSTASVNNFSQINLTKNTALKVQVYGNGDKSGALLLSMYCATDSGRTDYLIPTSHEGWREFILIDADNSDYDYTFSGITNNMHTFANYRYNPDLKTINRMTITPTGNTSGVKMDDIRAYTAVDAPAKNPTVTIGKTTITFEAEIHSGEYIEFYPETGKAYLNYYTSTYNEETGAWIGDEPHTKEINYTGSLSVPSGSFTYKYSAESLSDAPLRALVKIGLQGKIIANPADWAAPEVYIPEGISDIHLS